MEHIPLIKKPLFLLSALALATAQLSHAVTVEERSLSRAQPITNEPTTEWKLMQQLKALQEEVSGLRGLVEVYEAKLVRLEAKQQTEHQQLLERVSGLEELVLAQEETSAQSPETSDATPEATSDETQAATPAQDTAAQSTQTADPSKATKAEQEDYLKAYNLFKDQGPEAGVRGMTDFITQHPKSVLVPRAHYWMGEFYLAQEVPNPPLAELNFMTIVKQYPNSHKAPTAIYRVIGLYDGDNRPKSKARELAELLIQKYPNAQEANLARSYLATSAP